MNSMIFRYYNRKFDGDISKAFIHVVRVVGDLAEAIDKGNREQAKIHITEIAALMRFLADKYEFPLLENLEEIA